MWSSNIHSLNRNSKCTFIKYLTRLKGPGFLRYEAKEMATVKLANGPNLAETLVERGYVNVIRHRQGDDSKSSEIDKLMEVEAKAISEKKGLHSGKDFPLLRIGDASESASKASSFLPSLKRSGRTAVVVDYVPSGSRFKLLLPKQDVKITFVLSGIRTPRTARNQNEKPEQYGPEAQDFASRKCLQRDAEIEVETVDKVGGFIGVYTYYLGSTLMRISLRRLALRLLVCQQGEHRNNARARRPC